MLNFTVGPVMSEEYICQMGAEQVPYFRTPEFSDMMLENEYWMTRLAKAPENSRAVFLTGSGTAAMEAAVMNCFTAQDKVLVVNGGSFGQRFVDLCLLYKIPFTEIKVEFGKQLRAEQLLDFEGKGYTGFLVNVHETSTGVHYNMELISDFCRRNHLFLVADMISSFLADPFDMEKYQVDVMITGSQKALACPPGISILVMTSEAVERINQNTVYSMYFDLKNALKNGERGQTPFTPAVGILRQIHERLGKIVQAGGAETEIKRVAELSNDFRSRLRLTGLPLEISSEALSNAVTPLHPLRASAYDVFEKLKEEYHIWVCPSGGELRDKLFRVGHIGALKKEDNTTLIEALKELQKRGIL